MKATAGAVYTVYNQYLKRYTACQVAYIAPPDSVSNGNPYSKGRTQVPRGHPPFCSAH